MSREHIDNLNAKRWMMVSASGFYIVTDPFGEQSVAMHLEIPEGQLSLPANTGLALRFSPQEARQVAEALQRKADAAEAVLPRA